MARNMYTTHSVTLKRKVKFDSNVIPRDDHEDNTWKRMQCQNQGKLILRPNNKFILFKTTDLAESSTRF